MKAEYLNEIIISTPKGFKLLGKKNPQLYPKTAAGLEQLVTAIRVGHEKNNY